MKKLTVFLMAALLLTALIGSFAEEARYVEITQEIIIRSKAAYSGDRIEVGLVGNQYEYVGEEDGWYIVRTGSGSLGYIPGQFGKVCSGMPQTASSGSQDSTETAGDVLIWGSYEQDNIPGNGKEPIEWIILARDRQAGKALLLSRYGLDCQPYNMENAETTWEDCSLRQWLNETFFQDAFTEEEKNFILITESDNNQKPRPSGWETDGGNTTSDRIFVLSDVEAWTYFDSNEDRICTPTEYAVEQGSSAVRLISGQVACAWWLRSPGSSHLMATAVVFDGAGTGGNVSIPTGTVRPAMWVDLSVLPE